jgi:anti-sigma regulatory factor (Ser/Thr protein kinase)
VLGYRHAVLMYAGSEEFTRRTARFIRAGVVRGEPTLVVVGTEKIDLLRRELGDVAERVEFADMHEVGANPALIIPAWRQFADSYPGQRLRGVGEPISAEREGAELVECQHHERLLNLAFADTSLSLLCPYDTDMLDPGVIAEARHSHPMIVDDQGEHPNHDYTGHGGANALALAPLVEPTVPPRTLEFDLDALAATRELVARAGQEAGLSRERGEDLVLAVHEVATNSVRHGGGRGLLRVWREPGALVCEIRDRGRIEDPLAGRRRPRGEQTTGYGLWLANQLCDLVQLRCDAAGNVARLHMYLALRPLTHLPAAELS